MPQRKNLVKWTDIAKLKQKVATLQARAEKAHDREYAIRYKLDIATRKLRALMLRWESEAQ